MQEQVIVQAIPEVVDSLPLVEEFTGPGFNQVHHEQNPAIPVVTEYFPMTDDEGSELSAGVRPAPLEEGRPQGKLQRHAGIGYELVLALDAPVLQMVEQLLDVHHFFATCPAGCCRAGYSRAQDHPREHPLADACVATRNWRNNWWKCRRSHLIPGYSLVWSTPSTFQFLVVVGVVDVSDALVSGRSLCVVGDRAPQRIVRQNIRMKSPRRSFTNSVEYFEYHGRLSEVFLGPGSPPSELVVGCGRRIQDWPHTLAAAVASYVKENLDPEVV